MVLAAVSCHALWVCGGGKLPLPAPWSSQGQLKELMIPCKIEHLGVPQGDEHFARLEVSDLKTIAKKFMSPSAR